MIKMIKKNKQDKNEEEEFDISIFEDMYESQVHEFVNQHSHLLEDLNVFKMAKAFEDRYDYVLKVVTDRVNSQISKLKEDNNKLYNKLIEQREKEINDEMDIIKSNIQKSIEHNNTQKDNQIKELHEIYHKKKEELINIVLKDMEINF